MTLEPVAVRAATPRVIAALMRRGATLDEAQDALQEALLVAAQHWPTGGAPEDPLAWLLTVARRRLIDGWRSNTSRVERESAVFRLEPETPAGRESDDSVALLMLCCHPDLPRTRRRLP